MISKSIVYIVGVSSGLGSQTPVKERTIKYGMRDEIEMELKNKRNR